ncbi:MAG: hypothetical protein J7L69_01665 [Desulfobulbaceae bacterium]|nr:hypothetical protein [Desulfobulbaceae bacterium]
MYPLDKVKNSEGIRRTLTPTAEDLLEPDNNADPFPPLLRNLLEDYAATGIPPAYIPMEEDNE